MTDKQALAALDAEFSSFENCESGRMKVDEYTRRRNAIEAQSKVPSGALTQKQIESLMQAVARAVSDLFARKSEVELLERRLGRLEAQPVKSTTVESDKPRWRLKGVWTQDEQYNADDVAVYDNRHWRCLASTRDAPGSSAWTRL